jgi:hypothetical protein
MRALSLSLVAFSAAALVLGAGASEAEPDACELPGAQADPLTDRAALLAQYERLPHACLTALFEACTDAAGSSLLDFGSAAVCSFGYEALLKQAFHGNFGALMAWWRSQRGEEPP